MSTILYLDGSCGISGDMTVAALLDLGADPKKLDTALEPLKHEGLSWTISRKSSYGIAGCDFDVHLAHEDHGHHHHDHGHHHAHRHLADVNELLETLPLTPAARDLAKHIFRIVAEAEAKAHGTTLEAVHFHEVGALDSLADIVGAAVLLDDLGITECVISPLAEGTGTVHCAHGELPVPVPAVLNIAQACQVPMRITSVSGERITPTGIAIAAAIRTQSRLPETFTIHRCGIGLGKRDFGVANALRAMIIETEADQATTDVTLLETNLDDLSGEALAHAAAQLTALGARDVTLIPCYMKKGRPGTILQVQCDRSRVDEFAECIFRETTAIGLRKTPLERICMTREAVTLRLDAGEVMGKRCTYGSCVRIYPEYESISALAKTTEIPFSTLFANAEAAARKLQGK